MIHYFIGCYIKGTNRKYHLPRRSSLNSEARCFHRSSPRSLQIFENTDHVTEIGTLRSATSLPPCGVQSDSSTSGMAVRLSVCKSLYLPFVAYSIKARKGYHIAGIDGFHRCREERTFKKIWFGLSNNGSVNLEHAVGD